MQHLKHAWLGMLFSGLAGCAGVVPPSGGTLPANVKSVGIITVMPSTIAMSYIGFTVFQNDFAVFPSEFDPNDAAMAALTADLSLHYKVVPISVDRPAIMAAARATKPNSWMGPVVRYVITDPVIQDYLKHHVTPGTADLIFVIDASEPDSQPRRDVPGYGLFSRGFVGGGGDFYAVAAHCEVFDGTNFQEITSSAGGNISNQSNLNWAGEPYASLSAVTKAEMADYEHRAIRYYVTAALQSTHLVDELGP